MELFSDDEVSPAGFAVGRSGLVFVICLEVLLSAPRNNTWISNASLDQEEEAEEEEESVEDVMDEDLAMQAGGIGKAVLRSFKIFIVTSAFLCCLPHGLLELPVLLIIVAKLEKSWTCRNQDCDKGQIVLSWNHEETLANDFELTNLQSIVGVGLELGHLLCFGLRLHLLLLGAVDVACETILFETSCKFISLSCEGACHAFIFTFGWLQEHGVCVFPVIIIISYFPITL